MAEELDIRSLWNKGKEMEDTSSMQVNFIEKKGTKTTLYWIKTILWIEFWLNVILIGPGIIYMLDNGYSKWFITLGVFITIIYLFYYQFLIRQIRGFNYDGNVIQSLKKVYGYLRFYILHYKVVIWVSMIVGLVSGFFDAANKEALQKIETTTEWLIVIGASTLFMAIIGGIMHFLVHLIYGRKIKRLKNTIKDFENEEE